MYVSRAFWHVSRALWKESTLMRPITRKGTQHYFLLVPCDVNVSLISFNGYSGFDFTTLN